MLTTTADVRVDIACGTLIESDKPVAILRAIRREARRLDPSLAIYQKTLRASIRIKDDLDCIAELCDILTKAGQEIYTDVRFGGHDDASNAYGWWPIEKDDGR